MSSAKSDSDVFFEAVGVVQRFVCALEQGTLATRSLSKALPRLERESHKLALEGLLLAVARRLDERKQLSRLLAECDLAEAVQRLARQSLRQREPCLDAGPILRERHLSDVAADRGVSLATLRRRIGKAAGMSPRELRRRHRIGRAVHLIRSGMKVEAAARESGYQSERSFYSAFHALTGIRPAAVRQLSDEEADTLIGRLLPPGL